MFQNADIAFDTRLNHWIYVRDNDRFPNGECEDIWGWDLGTVDGLNETIGTYYGIYNKNYRKNHCSQIWMCKGKVNKLLLNGVFSLQYEVLICMVNINIKTN